MPAATQRERNRQRRIERQKEKEICISWYGRQLITIISHFKSLCVCLCVCGGRLGNARQGLELYFPGVICWLNNSDLQIGDIGARSLICCASSRNFLSVCLGLSS